MARANRFGRHSGRVLRALLLCSVLFACVPGCWGIGCFVCTSFDGENKACEDPFNSTLEAPGKEREGLAIAFYNPHCWAEKKGRQGRFPADHCIKINGVRSDNSSKTMFVRTCALDSGTLTADTEIVRMSNCGRFRFNDHHYEGCVQACDTDGCNSTHTISLLTSFALVLFAFFLIHF